MIKNVRITRLSAVGMTYKKKSFINNNITWKWVECGWSLHKTTKKDRKRYQEVQ